MDGFTDAIRVVVVGDWIFSVMPPELVMKERPVRQNLGFEQAEPALGRSHLIN